MLIRKEPEPSERALRTLWPDTREEGPPRAGVPPRKTDEERERSLREKWSNPQHAQTTVAAGDGRRKFDDGRRWPARQKFTAPTPEEGNHKGAIANPVTQYGTATRGIPGTWGEGLGATSVREHGAKPVETVLRDPCITWVNGEPVVEPGKGEIRRNPDGSAQTVVTGLRGGGERVVTKQGARIVYPASDKLPCHGTGMRTPIERSVEQREGKRGTYTVLIHRSRCKGCGIVRDVPRKIAEANPPPDAWEYPEHAQPQGTRERGGYQDHGAIMALRYEHRDRAGDRIVATVERPEPADPFRYSERPIELWAPAPACPEEHYGYMVNLAMGASEYADRDKTRGMQRHRALMREALADKVPIHLPIYLTVEDGRIVERRGVLQRSAPAVTVDANGRRAVANGPVRVSVTDIEAARAKRAATPTILCDSKPRSDRSAVGVERVLTAAAAGTLSF